MPILPSDSTDARLQRLADAIDASRAFPALEGRDYMRSHVAFEAASDQQDRIRTWLRTRLLADRRRSLDVASVGAGSGILDVPLIEAVSARKALTYHVVEPVEAQCEALLARAEEHLEDEQSVELSVECSSIEELVPKRSYDYVLAIHSTYYFADLEAALTKLLAMVRPDGRLLLAIAPREEMNQLAELFWASQLDQPLQFERELTDLLTPLVASLDVERIDASLSVQPEGRSVEDVASFLIQTPLEQLDAELREGVLGYLREVGGQDLDHTLEIPHPVTMLEVRPKG